MVERMVRATGSEAPRHPEPTQGFGASIGGAEQMADRCRVPRSILRLQRVRIAARIAAPPDRAPAANDTVASRRCNAAPQL